MLKAERERKTRRVQLAIAPSLYAEVLDVGRRAGAVSFTECVETALLWFVSERNVNVESK